jgi:Zn-dependent metalloprotease
MKQTLKLVLSAAALIAAWPGAQAAKADHPAAARAIAHLKSEAQGNQVTDHAYATLDVTLDPNGSSHVRLARTYQGLRVIGGDVVVHADAAGSFRPTSRTLRAPIRIDTLARFDDEAAASYAETQFRGERDGRARAELVVYARGGRPVLAYDVTMRGISEDGSPSTLHVIVDADSLQVLARYDDFVKAGIPATGTGKTLLEGTVPLSTQRRLLGGGGYVMRDPTRSNNYTVDMNNKTSGSGTVFTDADNVWGNSTNNDRATVGADAHYGLALTWDFYDAMFGRDGIDGNGRTTFMKVHYGRNYSNAGWDNNCFCMVYGDGDGRTVQPLVAIDVAGHEMTHGVTASTARLIYAGESGGLNEGSSDIMGTMVEFAANNPVSPPNYLMGERVYIANNGIPQPTKALRYMFKPSLDRLSPDCYSGAVANMDPHYSSGIANHFFYLLAEGAVAPANFGTLSPSDLVCNGNTALTGIGRDAATRIWYRALTVYMTDDTTYADARAATLSAATDLYGAGSAQVTKVAAAWSAVNVN